MDRKAGQRTAWLTVTVISLGLIGAEPSGSEREGTAPQTSTGTRDVTSPQNPAPLPLKGSPELWKFRFVDR